MKLMDLTVNTLLEPQHLAGTWEQALSEGGMPHMQTALDAYLTKHANDPTWLAIGVLSIGDFMAYATQNDDDALMELLRDTYRTYCAQLKILDPELEHDTDLTVAFATAYALVMNQDGDQ